MSEYVIILPIISGTKDILLVTKAKPEWQKGKLNLLGGKVELNETPTQAAIRELYEESGIEIFHAVKCGEIRSKPSLIHCFYADLGRVNITIKPRPEEIEQFNFYNWDSVKYDHRLIPNLKIIIPLLRMRVEGWCIFDNQNSLLISFGDKYDQR